MCTHQRPLNCIVPPHMLQNIITEGTPAQKKQALDSMASGHDIREKRVIIAESAPIAHAMRSLTKDRVVYDAEFRRALPGKRIRAEGEPPATDPAVNEAFDGAGATYDLFRDVYGRNSIDDLGLRIESTVHYDVGYDNAFWNGTQMVYGDGDEDLPEEERLFNRFTIALDIIGHELTHGVTQFSAGMVYNNKPGALNESMSDVFGTLVRQRVLNQTAQEADWVIGAGLFTSNVNGIGIRSMKAPGTAYDDPILGKDPQPGHMDDYDHTTNDNGGVHINSGIPNRAFYLTAVALGGFAWEKAGRIWYVTLRDKLRSNSDFAAAAQLTYRTAGELYSVGGAEQQAVRDGWAGVGIIINEEDDGGNGGGDGGNGGNGPTPEPSGCFPSSLTFIRSLFGE